MIDKMLELVENNQIHILKNLVKFSKELIDKTCILNEKQKEFIAFVLSKYVESGVDELDQEKLPQLLINKYQSLEDAMETLGEVNDIRELFIEFQKYLYEQEVA